MREITGRRASSTPVGGWRVIAKPAYGAAVNLTTFRGAPASVGANTFTDPFGAEMLSLTFEEVGLFDLLGFGDLDWAVADTNIDLVWDGPLPDSYPFGFHKMVAGEMVWVPTFRWEGYITTFGRSDEGLTVQCKGGMFQLDNFKAKPEYTSRPLPYEWAIARHFIRRPSLRTSPLSIEWPDWWSLVYEAGGPVPSYLIPAGVRHGEKWSGLTTRTTGQWDPVLTSYIQTLLMGMQTERGRWSMELDPYRRPRLYHRDYATTPGPGVVTIDPLSPGVKIDIKEDWENSLTTVFGQGTSLAGVAYSGMQVSANGAETSYQPLAARRQVYPDSKDNGFLDSQVMARETLLQMQEGLSADDGRIVARAHLNRFSDPGQVGTITLEADVLLDGQVLSRHLVRAGMPVHVPMILGRPEGVTFHVTKSSSNPQDGTVTLTVDSKTRDALTVEQVRLRGRDALSVTRMLVAGQYQPPIPDAVFPWNYAEGSGFVPSSPSTSAVKLFEGMPDDVSFPWTEWTTQRPPNSARWSSSYVRLGPASPSSANDNWAVQNTAAGTAMGIPIRMAQAGQIRLLQIAAYDAAGNVLKVPFHVSFYAVSSVNVNSMPLIPAEQAALFAPYAVGQHYPFVKDGFERYKDDGTLVSPEIPQPVQSAGLLRAYGTYYEKAGYWPGSYAQGDPATGLLVDASTWAFDLTGVGDAQFDPYSAERNLTNPKAGNVYAMIYCDAQADQEVFFLGRMYRSEPGSGV